jgi:NADH pyrophosphatase NudC (nudix superfamily)
MAASFPTSSFIRIVSISAINVKPKAIASRRPFNLIRKLSSASKYSLSPTPTSAAAAGATAAALSPHFSDLPLDRAAHLRKNISALEQLLDDSRASTIAFYDRKALVAPLLKNKTLEEMVVAPGGVCTLSDVSNIATHAAVPSTFVLDFDGLGAEAPDGGPPAWIPLTWHPRNSDLLESVDHTIGFIFLGLCHSSGAPVFACRLLELTPKLVELLEQQESNRADNSSGASPPVPSGASLVDVRSQGQKMTSNDAAIYALASGLLSWHSNTQFCSKTGSKMDPDSAGHARRPAQLKKISNTVTPTPTADGGSAAAISSDSTKPLSANDKQQRRPRAVYPRIDPAVIVAVTYGNWLLLGRKKSWDPCRYSLLAGFSEVGETLEDAVVREVSEESGVVVDKSTIVYHSSQPWPFPQSLMIGFLGEARHLGRGRGVAKSENESNAGKIIMNNTNTLVESRGFLSGLDIFTLGSPARNAALDVGLKSEEIDAYATPAVVVDQHEIEDARWFHREWLLEHLLNTEKNEEEHHGKEVVSVGETNLGGANEVNQPKFRIPGKYALANRLISDWILGFAYPRCGENSSGGEYSTRVTKEGKKESPPSSSSSWSGYSLPDVQIDQGVFKYILLRASSSTGSPSKLLVRGDCRAAYHNHILTTCIAEAAKIDPGIVITVLGGGRMEHYYSHPRAATMEGGDVDENFHHRGGSGKGNGVGGGVVTVYGYSAAFGPAPHEMTAAVLKKWDPFLDVSVSYEGY